MSRIQTFRLTPIAYAMLSVCSALAYADTPPPADAAKVGPTYILADKLSGQQGIDTEAEGRVELHQPGRDVYADWLRYQQSGQIDAKGNIRLIQGVDKISGSTLKLDTNTRLGELDNPVYELGARNGSAPGSGQAEKIIFAGVNQYELQNGTYSSCRNPDPDWYLKAESVKLDMNTHIGETKNAQMVFKGVPIAYIPWIDFPLNNQRKTGFLAPTFGTTNKGGAELTVPYYWNIAPNRDLTVSSRLISRRGLQILGDFRYLEPNYTGSILAEYLPNDRIRGEDRFGVHLNHIQTFNDNWTAGIDASRVSDDLYFADLSDHLSSSSTTNLQQEAWLRYQNAGLDFVARTQRYQTLQDPSAPLVVRPFAQLPEFNLNWQKWDARGFDFNLAANLTHFGQSDQAGGTRLVIHPRISRTFQTQYAYFTPTFALDLSRYNMDKTWAGKRTLSRALPIFSVDGGLTFERQNADQSQMQTLEPRLYYVNIPYRNQSDLPVFDTAQSDFNFTQLFSENRFVGRDRINEANDLTLALTSRAISNDSGKEIWRVALGQRFYLSNRQRVTLGGSGASNDGASDWLIAARANLNDSWSVSGEAQMNKGLQKFRKFRADVQYQPELGKVINASYRFDGTPSNPSDRVRQLDISAQWPLGQGWSAVGRWNYSLRDRKTLETVGGLEYAAGCWIFRAVAQSKVVLGSKPTRSIFLQLELGDIARVGANPLQLLKTSVPGYQELRTSTGPLP